MNITNHRQDKKECIPDEIKESCPEKRMLDKGLSQMKKITINKDHSFLMTKIIKSKNNHT